MNGGAGGSGGEGGAAAGGGGGEGAARVGTGTLPRVPTWRERENNRRRERRRRAIASKIFTGLRAHGNYALRRHCDNNEVLRALCEEAGFTVEPDGTTYRKGCKPGSSDPYMAGFIPGCSSLSPGMSCPVTPGMVSCPVTPRGYNGLSSPSSPTHFGGRGSSFFYYGGASSSRGGTGGALFPWLNNLSHSDDASYADGYSFSAPVTPQNGSPPRRKMARWAPDNADAGGSNVQSPWATSPAGPSRYASLPVTTPHTPVRGKAVAADPVSLLTGLQISAASASKSPAAYYNMFDFDAGSYSSRPAGQSSGAAAAARGGDGDGDAQVAPHGFSFGRSGEAFNAWEGETATGTFNAWEGEKATGAVSAWEGEKVSEEYMDEGDLELTLGNSRAGVSGADRA